MGLIGGEEVIRVRSGLWTRVSQYLPRGLDIGPESWTYPPRQYYASHADVLAELASEFVVNGNYGSKFVTVKPGTVARLDFDFREGDDP